MVSGRKAYQDALSVRRKVFIEEQNVSEEEEIDEHEQTAAHFIAYNGDEPVGAGRFRQVEDKGKVERICVLPSHRMKKVGQRMMFAIENYAREKGLNTLTLGAQTHAQDFYNRLGYETYSDVFDDAGIPHVAMKKKIDF